MNLQDCETAKYMGSGDVEIQGGQQDMAGSYRLRMLRLRMLRFP